jgi:hypothetical protein
MTAQDIRTTTIPQPRTPADDSPAENAPAPAAAEPAREFPWPEPWRANRGARPRSEYWDVASASWHSRGPIAPTD